MLCIKIIDVKRIIILAQIFGYNAMGRYNVGVFLTVKIYGIMTFFTDDTTIWLILIFLCSIGEFINLF